MITIIISVIALAAGVFTGKVIFSKVNKDLESEAQKKADDILKNAAISAENIKKDRMLEAKENFLRLKAEFEEDTQNRLAKRKIAVDEEDTTGATVKEQFKKTEEDDKEGKEISDICNS